MLPWDAGVPMDVASPRTAMRTRSRRPKGHPTFSRRSWRKPLGRANLWIGIQVLHHHGAVFFMGLEEIPSNWECLSTICQLKGKKPHKIWNICYIYIYIQTTSIGVIWCYVNVNYIRVLFISQMWRAWVNRSQPGSLEMMCTSPRQSKDLISIMRCGVFMGKVSWVWVFFSAKKRFHVTAKQIVPPKIAACAKMAPACHHHLSI